MRAGTELKLLNCKVDQKKEFLSRWERGCPRRTFSASKRIFRVFQTLIADVDIRAPK